MTEVIRQVSTSELAHVKVNALTSAKIVLTGSLDPEVFGEALLNTINKHPLAKSIIRSNGDVLEFVQRTDTSNELEIIDLIVSAEKSKLIVEDFLNQGLNVERALYRFMLIPLAEKKHLLIFAFHHAICDGRAIFTFSSDLLAGYSLLCSDDKAKNVSFDVAPAIDDYSPDSITCLPDDEILGTLQAEINVANPINLWPMLMAKGDASKSPPRIKSLTTRFSIEFTSKLLDRARTNKCTISGALGASLLYSIRRVANLENDASVLSCKYAVDLRERVASDQSPEQLNCYVVAFNDFQSLEAGFSSEGFWACGRKISASLRKYAESNSPFLNMKALGIDKKPQNANVTSLLSNIGKVDLGSLPGALAVEEFSIQGVTISPCVLVTAIHYLGTLQLDFLYTIPWVSDEKAQEIGVQIEQIFNSVVS